jgi:hypothetical protein
MIRFCIIAFALLVPCFVLAANPTPVSGKQWNNAVEGGTAVTATITSPTSGAGRMLVFAGAYGGGDSGWSVVSAGGTNVTITERLISITNGGVGVAIADITYDAAPTSVTLQQDGALGNFYASIGVTEVQDMTAVDVVSATENTGTGSNATATNLPDTTDAQGAVFGVWTQEDFPGGAIENGAGWTELFDLDNGNDAATLHVQYKSTTAGSNDPVWSHSSLTYHAAAIGLDGVAAGGGLSIPIVIHHRNQQDQ